MAGKKRIMPTKINLRLDRKVTSPRRERNKNLVRIESNKRKYFGQNPLFHPLPYTKIRIFLPYFQVTKVDQNHKIRCYLARRAEIFEYLVLTLTETIIKGQEKESKGI